MMIHFSVRVFSVINQLVVLSPVDTLQKAFTFQRFSIIFHRKGKNQKCDFDIEGLRILGFDY